MSSSDQWSLSLPETQRVFLEMRLDRFNESQQQAGLEPALAAETRNLAARVFLASDFAFAVAEHRPLEFNELLRNPKPALSWPIVLDENNVDFMARLRRFRRLHSTALIVRDIAGIDSIEASLQGANTLALTCIEAALEYAAHQLSARYGVARSSTGTPQRLAIIGMGKLGGSELNFSSDVDLILAFAEAGHTDGPQILPNEEYFARLGQRLAQLLSEVSMDGFVLRVDYRLRPYGNAGRIALSFNAMEQYYQREGRDWERYAWIKAQAVAGDRTAGAQLIAALRPFVYRRYLDFTAIEGLRELKARIDSEVERKDLADNLKSGPGGIRELEFAVQLAQLIRGGREPPLRVSGFLPALAALHANGQFDRAMSERIRACYLFLRHIENRVQMLADTQTHSLPDSAFDRTRLAITMGYANEPSLLNAIQSVRSEVQDIFANTLDPPAHSKRFSLDAMAEVSSNFTTPEFTKPVQDAIAALFGSLPIRRMETRTRERFERALPLVVSAAQKTQAPEDVALRLLRLLHTIAGRPSYLALLAERRAAREHLAEIFACSTFLAERVIAHPLLLDDVLDNRVGAEALTAEAIEQLLVQNLQRVVAGDAEAELAALHETKQSAIFRTALSWLNRAQSAVCTARAMASIAETCVREVLRLARRDLLAQHGEFPAGLLVLAYGSFGGEELGFGSDLDLVFLFDSNFSDQTSTGIRPLECQRYMARLSQRILHWLGTPTATGALYDIDTRLRPDGAKGLLVSPLAAFRDYQLNRAWAWEHQASVRARVVAGPEALRLRFEQVRRELLCRARDANDIRTQAGRMRARWRQELDRSNPIQFDLKQGSGGLVDIEFLLQGLVLLHASRHPELIEVTATANLIKQAALFGLLSAADADCLLTAHSHWLAHSLDCTLNTSPRLIKRTPKLELMATAVAEIISRHGFFDRLQDSV